MFEQGGESCLKAEGFCVVALWKQDGLISQLWDGVEDSLAFSCIFHSLFLPTS